MELNSVNPLELLQQLSSRKISGHLQISSSAVNWSIYLDSGKVLYVTHSVEPFDRLYSRLRRLSRRVPALTKELCEQIGSCFARPAEKRGIRAYDYDALIWLHQQQYLSLAQVVDTLEVLSQEALEPLLLIQSASLVLTDLPENSQAIGGFNLSSLLRHCEQRLQGWQSSEVPVFSPYQRPYYVGHVTPKQPLPELNPKFCAMLKGLSIRHLAAMINRDELDLFRSLTPYIQEKVIYLREPQKPFDQLPKISASVNLSIPEAQTAAPPALPSTPPATKTYGIVCIDDSPTITSEINRFLGDGDYTVTAINNPVKAMMQVLRLKPNLILLDVGMPIIDGYELCRLLRKNIELKKIPIIMVTGHTGFLDRARATLVGASDYLTKPFTREGLLEVVQRNLNGK